MLRPKRIIHSKNVTVVFWNDDTKTLVRRAVGETPDNYTAFCAAYCKKVFGNNSHLKRIIKDAENAKPGKVIKNKDHLDSLTIPSKYLSTYNEYVKRAFSTKLLSLLHKPVNPGCENCSPNCPDRFSANACWCNAYNNPEAQASLKCEELKFNANLTESLREPDDFFRF